MDTEAIYSYLTGMVISFTSDITMVQSSFSQLHRNMFIGTILYYRPWIARAQHTRQVADITNTAGHLGESAIQFKLMHSNIFILNFSRK